jgi:hypothetical protein
VVKGLRREYSISLDLLTLLTATASPEGRDPLKTVGLLMLLLLGQAEPNIK